MLDSKFDMDWVRLGAFSKEFLTILENIGWENHIDFILKGLVGWLLCLSRLMREGSSLIEF